MVAESSRSTATSTSTESDAAAGPPFSKPLNVSG